MQNAASPLLLVIVARVNGIGDVGLYSFAFSVSVVFFALAIWGGRTYQVSDVHHEYTSQSYVVMRILLGAVVAVVAALFAMLISIVT